MNSIQINNYTKIINYIYIKSLKEKKKKININFVTYEFEITNKLLKIPYHTFCIYTKRNRSIFHNYKMSRHKLKEFLDYRSISNIYIR
jgi:hypothetical protein